MSVISMAVLRPASSSASDELRSTLERQRSAFLKSAPPGLAERRADLAKLGKAIRESAPRLAEAISADFGNRSRHETMLAEVFTTLAGIRHATHHLPRWMKPKRVSVSLELMPAQARILYQPVGVVGIISPWNYPFQLAMMPLLAALAAGNRVMLKPSELTPRTGEFMAELLAGLFPSEQVATVLGGPEVGAAFSRLPFDHLFYTGSTAVGRLVMQAAAENLTPVTLELGGKSPCIIGEDAALAGAAESVAYGKLLNAGQTCIAPDYVLVPEAQREAFINLLGQAVRKLYPTLKANPDYTSIVNERHYRRLAQYLDEAKAKGSRVVELNPASETLDTGARKLAPTLVVDPAEDLALMRDEIFGPILPIKTYRGLDDAIDYVNRRPRPLALYYFGADAAKRDDVLARTISGGVSVNETLMHIVVENLPFGGVGASGIGAYHGEIGFQTFSHRKGVFLQSRINGSWMLRPPFGKLTDLMLKVLLRR
ncbi:MAG TPA: coniferyl aldehyde dehydrogenase [Stellaceae bacterium]|jgi:coniferyl-aldehyde dehydrogenase|nr:coniferyl aldehyde dehydrogenase [Stellaceae bacterium]